MRRDEEVTYATFDPSHLVASTAIFFGGCTSSREDSHGGLMTHYARLRAASGHAAMFISLLAITAPAFSAEVSGKVYLDGRPFVGRLTLPNGSQVDINGDYKIFVPAGVYSVVLDENGRQFGTTIQSSTVPVVQDINLSSRP